MIVSEEERKSLIFVGFVAWSLIFVGFSLIFVGFVVFVGFGAGLPWLDLVSENLGGLGVKGAKTNKNNKSNKNQ